MLTASVKHWLIGQKFGRLEVTEYVGLCNNGNRRWRCICACGTIKDVASSDLKTGHTKSCGCLRREKSRLPKNITHDATDSPEYAAWANIKYRCSNQNCHAFSSYGGRGILICEQWAKSFEAFLADVGPRPSPQHSIDRYPNNDGSYEPGNVRWATRREQQNNTRQNKLITVGDVVHVVGEWSRITGIPSRLICKRLRNGWTAEEAVTLPKFKRGITRQC